MPSGKSSHGKRLAVNPNQVFVFAKENQIYNIAIIDLKIRKQSPSSCEDLHDIVTHNTDTLSTTTHICANSDGNERLGNTQAGGERVPVLMNVERLHTLFL